MLNQKIIIVIETTKRGSKNEQILMEKINFYFNNIFNITFEYNWIPEIDMLHTLLTLNKYYINIDYFFFLETLCACIC